jgi:hypothetical protein
MAKAKENYTAEQTEMAVGMYMGVRDEDEKRRDAVVKEIAGLLGKGERSVRAKLAREVIPGTTETVYIAKTPLAKNGKPAVKKEVLATRLAAVSGVPLTSAENMTKPDLEHLIDAFVNRDHEIALLEAGDFVTVEHDENGDVSE